MGKYHAYVLASTKRLGRLRERLTTKSDWAVTAALNLLWEKSNDRSLLDIQEQKDQRAKIQRGRLSGRPLDAGEEART